ncbi:S8 family serine peptidase [Brevibacillus sp. SYSU BS000544]|uniref:S8 family serine peptidase n=1 Tax=Brevibacillus sp. SYSU BS000544 TaxID=3416443 RepID=UPI003CE58865
MLSLKKVAKSAMLTIFSLSLVFSSLPALAKEHSNSNGKREVNIEAKEGLSLRSSSLVKKLSHLESSSKLVIVQLEGPIQEEWKEQLEEAGAELGDYIPDYAFIAKVADKKDRKQITDLPFVKRISPFHAAYKIAPELANDLDSKKQQKITVVGFNKQDDVAKTVKKISSKIDDVERSASKHIATLSASGKEIEKLLESDDVIAVVPVYENKLFNDVAAKIIHSDKLEGIGYTGKNQIVGVADSGLDTGDTSNIHQDFTGRIKKLYGIGRPGDPSDPHGHGTHVAGSILGSGKASGGDYKGMAPDAKLVFHSFLTEDGKLNTDLETILNDAYKDGARIHSDSWGAPVEGEYTESAAYTDEFLWEHKDMTVLFAAGNEGDNGYKTIGSPGTAKNVITVGASENYRPNYWNADNIDEIASFSSRGPTVDGRIKPDIVAPGTYILSTRSSLAPDGNFWELFNDDYAFMGGTSMATPVLAGGVAQVRQFLQEKGVSNPSGALLKSMLLTAADLTTGYMEEQGFGRANLQATIETTFVDETKGLQTGNTATYTVDVTDTSKPFAATVAWTDYPASLVAERTLVNDINMIVTSPSGKVYHGNDYDEDTSDEFDNLNNVEQVYPESEKGKWTVQIIGKNIVHGPQPYALSTNGKLENTGTTPDMTEITKTGTVTTTTGAGKKRYQEYSISVKKKGKITATLDWEGDADLNLFLKNSKGKEVAKSATKDNPETIEFDATTTGTYKVRVYAQKGTGKFTLKVSYPKK